MNVLEKIATFTGSSLTLIAIVLLWYIDWVLGFLFSVFAAIVFAWYVKLRREGNYYLKRVSELTGCSFEEGGPSYGRVIGSYRERWIEVRVNSGYDTIRGLSGLSVSIAALNSAFGALAGMKNFTVVRLEHKAHVPGLLKIGERVYAGKGEVLYIPPCDEASGLPKMRAEALMSKIDEVIDMIERLE